MKSTLQFIIVLLFTTALGMSATAQTTNEDSRPAKETQTVQTVKIKVSGITCSGDIKDIEAVLNKTNGILSCKPVGKASANSSFEITFNPAVISDKEIRKAVESTPGCENPDDRPYKVKKA